MKAITERLREQAFRYQECTPGFGPGRTCSEYRRLHAERRIRSLTFGLRARRLLAAMRTARP